MLHMYLNTMETYSSLLDNMRSECSVIIQWPSVSATSTIPASLSRNITK